MRDDRAHWPLALAATLTMAVSYVNRQTLSVLAPTITKELHISDPAYGWLAAAFSIAYLVGAPLAGRLIDAVGARRGLLGAVLAWSAVAALHAIAPGFGAMFALRIALGLAEAPSFPGAAQAVQRALPPAQRARGFGVLFTGSSLGSMLAPPLATLLTAHLGWRFAFVGVALVGLAWIPLWVALAFAPRGRAALDGGGGNPQRERPTPGAWVALTRNVAALRAVAAVLSAAPASSFMVLWASKFLVRAHHVTQDRVGRLLWIPPLFFDAGAVLFGHLASLRGARPRHDGSPPRALFAAAAALTATIAILPHVDGPVAATLIGGVVMAGSGGVYALVTSDLLQRVPPALVSTAGGMVAAAQSLAYVVAAPLVGASVERNGSFTPILGQLALAIVPGAALWLLARPGDRERG